MNKAIRNYENLNKSFFDGEGQFGIPIITGQAYEEPCGWVGFNYAAGIPKEKREQLGIHFFLDDYQFQRFWNRPDYYLPLLKQFRYVLSPDFSLFCDFPKAIQIYNHYRKHWLGAYLQQNGVKVIPAISWSDTESFSWCFDGEPTQEAVCVSSVGTQLNSQSRKNFMAGYHEMLKRLHPREILFYGNVPKQCEGNIIPIKAFQQKFRKGD